MSKAIQIHGDVREWDGYALFDEDNVLGSPTIFYNLSEAKRVAHFHNLTVWNITIKRKEKVNDNNAVKV